MRGRKSSKQGARRFVVASAIAVVVTAAFLPGAGLGSSGTASHGAQMKLPAGLVSAIRARLGTRAIRSGSSSLSSLGTDLGLAVSLSADGTTALVGAPGVGGNKGAAYIFHSSDPASWSSSKVPAATLTNGHGSRLFGLSVVLSSDGLTAFVGAPFTGGGLFPAGAIFVFHASAEDAWASSSQPSATLTVTHGIWAGISLALSQDGTTLIAGAPFYGTKTLAGGAYIFHAASESSWSSTSTPVAILTNSQQNQNDSGAGFAVAISQDGTTALVSDDGNTGGGGAYVFHASAENSWGTTATPAAVLTDSGSGVHDALGSALAISGDGTVAILGASSANSSTGLADVYHSSGEASWATTATPTAQLTNPGGASGDLFAENVALSSDGTTALVFAPGVNSGRGAAYVFHAATEGAWPASTTPTATLTNPAGHPKDILGVGALSADGATALVGAPGADVYTGAAYVYHSAGEALWSLSTTPAATLTDDALAACVVPKLAGLSLPAAKTALATGRCRLGKVGKIHAHSRKKRGRVLAQSKKAGKRLAIGAKVNVKVGK